MSKPNRAVYLAPKDAEAEVVPSAWVKRARTPIDHSTNVWDELKPTWTTWPRELCKRYSLFVVEHENGHVGKGTGKVILLALRRGKTVVCKGPKGRVRQVTRLTHVSSDWGAMYRLRLAGSPTRSGPRIITVTSAELKTYRKGARPAWLPSQAARVLFTGSRGWMDKTAAKRAVRALAPGSIVVHGRCRRGLDAMVDTAARKHGYTVEAAPADWDRHGKTAGHQRNQAMVNQGAALCFAFPTTESPGTRDCMKRARAAGIQVVKVVL